MMAERWDLSHKRRVDDTRNHPSTLSFACRIEQRQRRNPPNIRPPVGRHDVWHLKRPQAIPFNLLRFNRTAWNTEVPTDSS
jgi:hypothetical protein